MAVSALFGFHVNLVVRYELSGGIPVDATGLSLRNRLERLRFNTVIRT